MLDPREFSSDAILSSYATLNEIDWRRNEPEEDGEENEDGFFEGDWDGEDFD